MFGSSINPGLGPLANAGAPTAGVSAVQTLTGTATGGTFRLFLGPYKTAALAFNASAAQVQAALAALPPVGAGNVACTGGALGTAGVVVTFQGALAGEVIPAITVDNTAATGGTVTVAATTAGVKASYRGAPIGALLTDTVNGILYINTGTSVLPVWTKVGTQS